MPAVCRALHVADNRGIPVKEEPAGNPSKSVFLHDDQRWLLMARQANLYSAPDRPGHVTKRFDWPQGA